MFLLVLLVPALSGYDWPVSGARVSASFAQEAWGGFGTGVHITAVRTPEGPPVVVRPISAGEIVFRYDPACDYTSLPVGLGGFVVVEHQERVRSLYSHLQPGTLPAGNQRDGAGARVGSDTELGFMGDSGAARGVSVGLSILDLETAVILNPLIVLPAIEDPLPPVIENLMIRRLGKSASSGDAAETNPGRYEILVEAYDLRDDVAFAWRMAPYGISLSLNGRQITSIVFDGLQGSPGPLIVAGTERGYSDVYAAEWTYRIAEVDLREGDVHMHVFVRDFAGNESEVERFLSIRE